MRFFSRYHIRSVQAWFGIYTADIPPLIPVIPGINSLSGNSSVIRPLFFTRELHRLFESVFNRAGEQSVTFGGKDEQRRERTPFFVKKRSKLLIACSGLVRLMGLEPIRSPIRPSNVRVCLFRHNRIFHCERYYNSFRCICQHKLCPKVNIFLNLCKFPPFALLQGAKRAAFML